MLNTTPSELVSKDKIISDHEFGIIVREVQKYHELKKKIRDGAKKEKAETENKEAQPPDLKRLKGELVKEFEKQFQKNVLAAVSKSDSKE